MARLTIWLQSRLKVGSDSKKVSNGGKQDGRQGANASLEQFGYKQELRRGLGRGTSFCTACCS